MIALAGSTGYPVPTIHSHPPAASQLLPTIGAAGTEWCRGGDYYRRMYLCRWMTRHFWLW